MTDLFSPGVTFTRWSGERSASVPPCPSWCTLPAGHPSEGDEIAAYSTTGRLGAEHHGPSIGHLFHARGLEFSDARGQVAPSVMIDDHAYRWRAVGPALAPVASVGRHESCLAA